MPRVGRKRQYVGKRYKPYKSRSRAGSGVTRSFNRDTPAIVPLMRGVNTGFPELIKVRLRYVDEIVMTSSAGAIVTNAFRMNSLFDPDLSGVGHQPYGFDQWAALYQNYTVLGSKLTATWSPFSEAAVGTLVGPWNVGVVGDDNGTISGNPITVAEMPRNDQKVLGRAASGNSVVKTSLTYSPIKSMGLDPYDDTVGAAVGSSPTQVYTGVCWANDINSTTSNLMLKVEIEFLVLFKKATHQSGS